MRRILLTTASVMALGLGGIGLASAQGTNTGQQGLSGNSTPPTASTQTQTQTQPRTAMTTTHRTMRTGRGEVIQAQRQLREEHLYRGRIDGHLGPQTRLALRHFQQQKHLPQTARLDNRTMQSLMGGNTAQMGQGSSRPPKTTHTRSIGQNKLQNTSQPTGTMGQGSSAQPNPATMTPPGDTTQPTPNTSAGSETNPNTKTNQK